MSVRVLAVTLLLAGLVWAQKYSGPRPPKSDVVYLLHASNLVETEVKEANQEGGKKDSTTYTVAGATSSARTPLAEPIFLLASEKLTPESLELYKFDVKNGQRQLTLAQRRRGSGLRALRLSVSKVDTGLYRIEAAETLENGEYGLSPSGSNKVYCFQVY